MIRTLDLPVEGMTCASCAARIEKRLNKIDGVNASVNYATGKAHVDFPDALDPQTLVAAVEAAGYSARLPEPTPEADPESEFGVDETAPLRHRFLVSAALSIPVIVLSMVPALQFTYWQWLCLTLTAPVVVWGAWPFHRAAWTNLRHRAATMDTLISIGTLAAFAWSLYALFFGTAGRPGLTHPFELTVMRGHAADQIYLEVAAGVTTFILLGRYLEARAKRSAGAALRALMEVGAKEAIVLRDGANGVVEQRIPVRDLGVDDRFVVRPGDKVATDGLIVDGASALDTSMLTGESVPVDVGPGDGVIGGTVNTTGRLVVRATRVGADTHLAQLARMVEAAQSGKAQVQRLADRISAVFVPIVIGIALATLVVWLAVGGGAVVAFSSAVAVLIVACPCALGLATPTALLVGTGRGAQLGIVIKGPEVLESTRRVDTVVLDKTGTVTSGRMTLREVHAADGVGADDVLQAAGAVEAGSEHPIAQAVAVGARERFGALSPVTDFTNHPGLGVSATIAAQGDSRRVLVGRVALLEREGISVPTSLASAVADAEADGATAFLVAVDGHAQGVVSVADAVKETSAEAVSRLRGLGLTPVLLTGDNARTARSVADVVGIDEVVAGVLPQDKVAHVQALQQRGRVVAMVGDGVNDAAALAQADLGIAMGSGTDAAIEASDLTLVRDDLRLASDAIRLARRTLATIKGNLFWAFAYNVLALPLAAAGLLNPMIAGAAMAFSSVFVVTNSLRLRSFRAAP